MHGTADNVTVRNVSDYLKSVVRVKPSPSRHYDGNL